MVGRDVLPREQEPLKFGDRNGLNFRAEAIEGETMDAREQTAIAPFGFLRVRVEFAAQNKSFAFEREQCLFDFAGGQVKEIRE